MIGVRYSEKSNLPMRRRTLPQLVAARARSCDCDDRPDPPGVTTIKRDASKEDDNRREPPERLRRRLAAIRCINDNRAQRTWERKLVRFLSVHIIAGRRLLELATTTGLARARVASGTLGWSIGGLGGLGRGGRRGGRGWRPAGGRSPSAGIQVAR